MSDSDAFAQFVATRHAQLVRFAFLLLGDRGHAEDLAQSALLRTYSHWRALRSSDAAHAYTRTTMTRLAARWTRRRWRGEIPSAAALDKEAADTTAARAAALDLYTALGALPWAQRAVLVLRYFEDLSEAQTAEILRCSPGTVKSRASRGLATLRSRLGPDAIDDTKEATRHG